MRGALLILFPCGDKDLSILDPVALVVAVPAEFIADSVHFRIHLRAQGIYGIGKRRVTDQVVLLVWVLEIIE